MAAQMVDRIHFRAKTKDGSWAIDVPGVARILRTFPAQVGLDDRMWRRNEGTRKFEKKII